MVPRKTSNAKAPRVGRFPWRILIRGSFLAAAAVAVSFTGCGNEETEDTPALTVAAQPTQQLGTQLPRGSNTPTVSATETNPAALWFGSWEVLITGWEELTALPASAPFGTSPIQEGWKRVNVTAVAKNTSSGILAGWLLRDDRYELAIVADTFDYRAYIVQGAYAGSPTQQRVPPGFGIKIDITADIPLAKNDYVLRLSTGGEVRRGVTATGVALTPPEGFLGETDTWSIPQFAAITYQGEFTAQALGSDYQYISFAIRNDYGRNLLTRYETELSLIVYLADGEVFFGGGERDEEYSGFAPGLTRKVDIYFGRPRPIDLNNAVLVLMYRDDESTKFIGTKWAAWKLAGN